MRALTLILLLFSFSAIGAEPKFSKTGLEGWGTDKIRLYNGVYVAIEPYSNKVEKALAKGIENFENKVKQRVEQNLKKAKFNVFPKPRVADKYALLVNAQPFIQDGLFGPSIPAYSLSIEPMRVVTYKDNDDKIFSAMAIVRGGAYGGIIPTKRIFELVDESMVKFLLDYHKANPKKKE